MADEETTSGERVETSQESDQRTEVDGEGYATDSVSPDEGNVSAGTEATEDDTPSTESHDADSPESAERGADREGNETTNPPSETEIEQLAAVVKDTRERLDELESKVSDYERRNEREHQEIKKYAVEDLASEMLQVKDMLGDAIEMEDLEEGTERRLGVVKKQFDKTITSGSIERIDPEPQEPYDDELHRMMEKVPTAEYEPGNVVDVLENGYRSHDRVIRPARVTVAVEDE